MTRKPFHATLLAALLAGSSFSLAADPFGVATPVETPPDPLPELLTAAKPLRLARTAKGGAVALTIQTALLRPAFGPLKAPPGKRLLVLNGEWRNVMPARAVQGEQKTTEYKIPKLADQLYVVINGREVGRVLPTRNDAMPGLVPVIDLTLKRLGDTVRGNMVFAIDAGDDVRGLEVRYYDPDAGGLVLPLVGPAQPTPLVAAPGDKPLAPVQANELLEAGVYGVDATGPAEPPPGMKWVRVDFRARSLVVEQRPAKKPGDKPVEFPSVIDWADARKYVQLVADGEYGYAFRDAPGGMGDAPRLLPDVMTGGLLTFLVPADAKSLELRCDFPQATVRGRTVTPAGLTLRVAGERPTLADVKPIVPAIDDAPFRVRFTAAQTTTPYAGRAAAAGHTFLAVDVTVQNLGKAGEFFQTAEQLKFLTAKGEQLPPLRDVGPHRPPTLLWVPPGERRRFTAVFEIAADEPAQRVGYSGVTKAQVVTLKANAVAPAGPVVAGAAAAESLPPDVALPPGKPAPPARKKQPVAELKVEDKAFPARVAARPQRRPKGLAGVGLTQQQVNAAVDRGADALWAWQLADLKRHADTFGHQREHYLTALALVHCGYHKRHPDFAAALKGLLRGIDPQQSNFTYTSGLAAMLVEGYEDAGYLPQMTASAQWLLDQQGPEGTWSYGTSTPRAAEMEEPERRVLKVVGGRPQNGLGRDPLVRRLWRKDAPADGDNSATQYATLGLHAASRAGVKVPADTFARLRAATFDRQNDDGGWGYTEGYSYGAMTCAGICTTALSRFESGDREPWKQESIERGLAWLNAHFCVDDHPLEPKRYVYYYLYSLERVGRILDTEFIGEHEWYPLGCQYVLKDQKPDGLWYHDDGGESANVAGIPTSFALLFLTRATASLAEPPPPSGPGRLEATATLPPGNRVYFVLDCSGSMQETMDGRPKFDIAKDAVRGLLANMPDNSEVALRAYGYRLRSTEPQADQDSKLLVPMGTLDRKRMGDLLAGLRARGRTPLAYSLEQAAGDLGNAVPDDKPVTVVLLTDGGEDTQPRKDPVAPARALGGLRNVRLRIVGFDINRPDWQTQLAAMATASHGQYLPAAKGAQLADEVKAAVFGVPPSFSVVDEGGTVVKSADFGTAVDLPPAKYRFVTAFAGRTFSEEFYVSPGETTTVQFDAAGIAADDQAADSAQTTTNARPTAADATTPKRQSKFCSNCGRPLKAGAKFCTNCGTKVAE